MKHDPIEKKLRELRQHIADGPGQELSDDQIDYNLFARYLDGNADEADLSTISHFSQLHPEYQKIFDPVPSHYTLTAYRKSVVFRTVRWAAMLFIVAGLATTWFLHTHSSEKYISEIVIRSVQHHENGEPHVSEFTYRNNFTDTNRTKNRDRTYEKILSNGSESYIQIVSHSGS